MFGLRPMGLRLVWETDEWDPVPSLNDDDDNWGVSDEEEDAVSPLFQFPSLPLLRLHGPIDSTLNNHWIADVTDVFIHYMANA